MKSIVRGGVAILTTIMINALILYLRIIFHEPRVMVGPEYYLFLIVFLILKPTDTSSLSRVMLSSP